MASKPPSPSPSVHLYYVLCFNLYDTIYIFYLMKTLLHNCIFFSPKALFSKNTVDFWKLLNNLKL